MFGIRRKEIQVFFLGKLDSKASSIDL